MWNQIQHPVKGSEKNNKFHFMTSQIQNQTSGYEYFSKMNDMAWLFSYLCFCLKTSQESPHHVVHPKGSDEVAPVAISEL